MSAHGKGRPDKIVETVDPVDCIVIRNKQGGSKELVYVFFMQAVSAS
jgi:hypothetical protein